YNNSAFDRASRQIGQYSVHLDGQMMDNLIVTSNVYIIDYHDSRFVKFAESIPQQERQAQQTQYGGMFAFHYLPQVEWLHALAIDGGGDFQIQDNRYQRYRTIQQVRQFQLLGQDFGLNNYGGYIQAVIEPADWLKITPAYRIDGFSGDFTNTL